MCALGQLWLIPTGDHLGKLRQSKVSVLLTEEELDRLERYCLELGYKKSTLIAR